MALIRVCDMHGSDDWWTEAETTRTFGIDGRSYEIDLCGEHEAELTAAVQPFAEHARPLRDVGQRSRR